MLYPNTVYNRQSCQWPIARRTESSATYCGTRQQNNLGVQGTHHHTPRIHVSTCYSLSVVVELYTADTRQTSRVQGLPFSTMVDDDASTILSVVSLQWRNRRACSWCRFHLIVLPFVIGLKCGAGSHYARNLLFEHCFDIGVHCFTTTDSTAPFLRAVALPYYTTCCGRHDRKRTFVVAHFSLIASITLSL